MSAANSLISSFSIDNPDPAAVYAGLQFRVRASASTGALIGLAYGTSFNDGSLFFRIRTTPSASAEVMRMLANGNVGIGTTNPASFKLQVAGDIGPNANTTHNLGSTALRWGCVWTSDGSTGTCASDERLEDHIEDLDFGEALAKVAALRPRTFTFNDDPDRNLTLGLIAQEAEEIAPELVVTDPETGLKAVRYGALPWLVLAGLQELAAKVNSLADEVAGFAVSFTSSRVTAENELCVDDLCITKDDLQDLLDLRGQDSSDPVTVTPPDPAPPTEPAAADDDIPEPDDDPDAAMDPPMIDAPSLIPADDPVPVLAE